MQTPPGGSFDCDCVSSIWLWLRLFHLIVTVSPWFVCDCLSDLIGQGGHHSLVYLIGPAPAGVLFDFFILFDCDWFDWTSRCFIWLNDQFLATTYYRSQTCTAESQTPRKVAFSQRKIYGCDSMEKKSGTLGLNLFLHVFPADPKAIWEISHTYISGSGLKGHRCCHSKFLGAVTHPLSPGNQGHKDCQRQIASFERIYHKIHLYLP